METASEKQSCFPSWGFKEGQLRQFFLRALPSQFFGFWWPEENLELVGPLL
jgi:hypothetical protein